MHSHPPQMNVILFDHLTSFNAGQAFYFDHLKKGFCRFKKIGIYETLLSLQLVLHGYLILCIIVGFDFLNYFKKIKPSFLIQLNNEPSLIIYFSVGINHVSCLRKINNQI
jgi:hypothetical protein